MSSIFLLSLFIVLFATSTSSKNVPNHISEATDWSTKGWQFEKESCKMGNPIDDCWRCDPEWESNRKRLADCAIGFGRNAVGGRDGEYYLVTDSDNDDPVNPAPGTLRYGVIQEEPLWIIFDQDMVIKLKQELIMNSYKTIDGRGHNIQIAEGPCITIQGVSNIIIHNIYIRDCVPGGNAIVRDSPRHAGFRGISDGDGISIFAARDVWIDHCTLANCHDGLIDAVSGSTSITISNNYMLHHNEAMLMGHSDDFLDDKHMQVTIAFNFFGEGLTQRMPRCRHGYFHIVNNIYTGWEMYAIGGSANPTINSQGNIFVASDNKSTKELLIDCIIKLFPRELAMSSPFTDRIRMVHCSDNSNELRHNNRDSVAGERSFVHATPDGYKFKRTKQSFNWVTKREISHGDEEWKKWNWRSDGDIMINGAYFTPSGDNVTASYAKASSMVARPASLLTSISPSAGALNCQSSQQC